VSSTNEIVKSDRRMGDIATRTSIADEHSGLYKVVRKTKVLVAEDHDDTREALKLLLELQGYEVVVARDGEDAFAVALQSAPDVVITDFDMPKLDGAGLVRELRSLSHRLANVPIVVLTALSQAMIQQAIDAGADAYVAKPVDFHTLEVTLSMLTQK
jgi:CheY-like chemotaxis protein